MLAALCSTGLISEAGGGGWCREQVCGSLALGRQHILGVCAVFLQSSVLQHPNSSPDMPCLLSGSHSGLDAQRAECGHRQCWQQRWCCVQWAVPKARPWQGIPALLQAGQGAPSRRMALPAGTDYHLLYLIEFGRLFFYGLF